MSKITASDGRDDHPTFIHSELDDFGLDPFAFRVYAHLARRASGKADVHWASVASTAHVCGMSERRVRTALRDLEEHCLVTRTERPGETSEYRLTPRRAWGAPATPAPRHQVPPPNTPTPAPDAGVPRHHMPPTPAPGAAKGTPKKELPKKEVQDPARKRAGSKFDPFDIDLPDHVNRDDWRTFAQHRREIRKKLTPTATKQLIALLEKHPRDANAMLLKAVERGWTGVFPLDPARGGTPTRAPTDFSPEKYVPTSAADLLTPSKETHR